VSLYVKETSINPFKILNKHLIDLKIKNQLESKLIIKLDVLFFSKIKIKKSKYNSHSK